MFCVGKMCKTPITQEKLKSVLKQPNGQEKYTITKNGNANFTINIRLPSGLTWYTIESGAMIPVELTV